MNYLAQEQNYFCRLSFPSLHIPLSILFCLHGRTCHRVSLSCCAIKVINLKSSTYVTNFTRKYIYLSKFSKKSTLRFILTKGCRLSKLSKHGKKKSINSICFIIRSVILNFKAVFDPIRHRLMMSPCPPNYLNVLPPLLTLIHPALYFFRRIKIVQPFSSAPISGSECEGILKTTCNSFHVNDVTVFNYQ